MSLFHNNLYKQLFNMHTWVDTTYSITARRKKAFCSQYRILNFSRLYIHAHRWNIRIALYKQKIQKVRTFHCLINISEWKEIESIKEGDIVYFINGLSKLVVLFLGSYFSNTVDCQTQYSTLQRVIETDKTFHVKLISRQQFMFNSHHFYWFYRNLGIPRIEQIIIPEHTLTMSLATCTTSMSTYITSLQSYLFLINNIPALYFTQSRAPLF